MRSESTSALNTQNPGLDELPPSVNGATQGAGKGSNPILSIGLVLAALGAGIALLFKVSTNGAKQFPEKGSNTILLIGLVAASGVVLSVFFKNVVVPRLKSWIRKVVLEEENIMKKIDISKPIQAEAITELVAAAVNLSKTSLDILSLKLGDLNAEALLNMLSVQQRELESLSSAILKLNLDSALPSSTPVLSKQPRSLLSTKEVEEKPSGIESSNVDQVQTCSNNGEEPSARDNIPNYPYYSPLGCTRIGPLNLDPRLIR